ncbi:glycosyltransferase family 4 protein [Paenibacillus allorhizosphaerae]|uniref:D-inositol-3-phosphate glycosyltransferase n=1 Tax=Paenibacillus allorhizosphaerae TaxID=2849866 RepID=A0ABN7TIG9_9BACL|nr:glycosyltransferase family 4 protein [Paenibacillus allorhizosphaerae]CAG7632387.1 D-inositol-3-phosphate glycosyltransferase [Paenibacillus allorhizosphaerae]
MNIAFYNHTSDVSGAEISLLLTAKHLKQAKPVLFAPEGELLQRARDHGLETVGIPSYRARLTRNPLLLLLHMLGMLWAGYLFAKQIRKHRMDIIHANSLRAGIMAALFCWMHRLPVVWHVRDNPPNGAIGKAIEQLASTAVSAILCISNSVIQGFDTDKLKNKLYLVHNGVSIREMTPEEKTFHRRNIREQLNTPPQSHVLVIIGQIAPWKRQEDAIRAAHRLIQDGMDVYLWVVGEPKFREENQTYRSSLGQLVENLQLVDRVRFTGFREDVLEICSAADLLLLCSDNEPFGRVIIEAMSQSLPIIATNAGGPREILENGTSGLLYEVGDVEHLAKHAAGLLTYQNLKRDMERIALKRVKEHFTIERTVEKVEAVYQEIVSAQAKNKLKFDKSVGKEVSP